MSLIRKHVAVLQAWACLALVLCNHDMVPFTKMLLCVVTVLTMSSAEVYTLFLCPF